MCLQRTWGNSDCSNWKRKQLKCMCIFFLPSFQMLLSSQRRGSQCRTLHAELLNEFFFMKPEWKTSLPLTPILSYWSVIVPRARQLLPPAPKRKGSSACIFKEDFDWSKIKQPQNILGDVNEKALDSLLHFIKGLSVPFFCSEVWPYNVIRISYSSLLVRLVISMNKYPSLEVPHGSVVLCLN